MANTILQSDLQAYRFYFNEALEMYGIQARYYQIKPGHTYTPAGELSANYYDPTLTNVIFDQVPKVSTLKKLGWVTELDQDQTSLIHIAFDTPGIQVGCLFEIKDPLTPSTGRFFRVTKLRTGIIYPVAVTCQIVPILGNTPEDTTNPNNTANLKPNQVPPTIFLDRPEEGEDEDVIY